MPDQGGTSDEIEIKTLWFGFRRKSVEQMETLKEGETKIMRNWSWKRMGYVRKAISLKNGKVISQIID